MYIFTTNIYTGAFLNNLVIFWGTFSIKLHRYTVSFFIAVIIIIVIPFCRFGNTDWKKYLNYIDINQQNFISLSD